MERRGRGEREKKGRREGQALGRGRNAQLALLLRILDGAGKVRVEEEGVVHLQSYKGLMFVFVS